MNNYEKIVAASKKSESKKIDKNKIVTDGLNNAYIIESLEENKNVNGFTISFRTYSINNECGGFLTTLWIANCPLSCANYFCGNKNEYNQAAKMLGAKINSYKTENKIPEKFRYQNIKNNFN